MIIAYQKHITSLITRTLILPMDDALQPVGTELATVDGITYVFLPDDATLPAQPSEIADSIQQVTLAEDIRRAIAEASPHVSLIRAQVAERIAGRYSTSDEIKLLRTAPSAAFDEYSAFVEACRAWGREKKAALGLGES